MSLTCKVVVRGVTCGRAIPCQAHYEPGAIPRCPRCRDTKCCGASDQERIEGLILALGQIARIGYDATGLVEAREALDKCVAIARKAILR